MSEGTEFNEVSGQQYGFKLDTDFNMDKYDEKNVENLYYDIYNNFKNNDNEGMLQRSKIYIDMDNDQIKKVRDENSVKRE